MPRRFRFRQVDVFTDRPLAGNPLAVFPDAEGLSDHEMQALAREMNLSETAFVLPATPAGADAGAGYRLRIFTPSLELPFAGHPSIGTAWVLATEGRIALTSPRTNIRQELPIGVLPLSLAISDARASGEAPVIGEITMTQGRPELVHQLEAEEIDELCQTLEVGVEEIGWPDADGRRRNVPPVVISTGLPHLIVPFAEPEILAEIERDTSHAVAEFASSLGAESAALIAPAVDPTIPDATVSTRVFDAARIGIEADPATGAAAGPIGVYLGRLARTRSDTFRLVIEQGVDVGRPSRLVAEVDFDADGRTREVRVAGTAVGVIEGWVTLPGDP